MQPHYTPPPNYPQSIAAYDMEEDNAICLAATKELLAAQSDIERNLEAETICKRIFNWE